MSEIPAPPKLRIGVLLESQRVPAWIQKAVREVESGEFAEVCLWIVSNDRGGKIYAARRLLRLLRRGLFVLYLRVDRALFRREHDALAMVDILEDRQFKDILRVDPIRRNKCRELRAPDVAKIQSEKLDVVLQFGFDNLRGEVLEAAACGVWANAPGHSAQFGVSLALFWEFYHKQLVSRSVLLQRNGDTNGPAVLYESYARSNLSSLYQSVNPIYWKGSQFAARCLRDLWMHGRKPKRVLNLAAGDVECGVVRAPGNMLMAGLLVRLAWRFLRNKYVSMFLHDEWHVAIRKRREFDGARFDASGFELLSAPPGKCFADPFLFRRGESTWLFVEEIDWKTLKGSIACCELPDNGPPSVPDRVLERDYHLSYPFVFDHDGCVYMIPETASNRTIELYQAVAFPLEWKLECVVLKGVLATDTTLFEHGGKLWLFAAMSLPDGSPNDELFVFFADAIHGPWQPHPMNPVVSDVRRARPAGNLFHERGEIIRPSQDCSRSYGSAVVFNKIQSLTETEYEEFEIGRIQPAWLPGGVGTHTYNRTDSFEVLDGRRPVAKVRVRGRFKPPL